MAKHEAVERLMEMASGKRADRVPDLPREAAAVPGAAGGLLEEDSPASLAPPAASMARGPLPADAARTVVLSPDKAERRPRAADRGMQFLQAVRPLLPAVAGAMRMVDHGAVQAIARLLPLLGGAPRPAPTAPAAEPQALHQRLLATETAHQQTHQQVQALMLELAVQEDEVRRLRTHLERVSAAQSAAEHETERVADRLRLVTAGTIILLMLLISQMVLLVVLFHK
ncbi:MAG TPA: hypothetical protein VGD62_11720 [Acidobacteriaceae bacterium]